MHHNGATLQAGERALAFPDSEEAFEEESNPAPGVDEMLAAGNEPWSVSDNRGGLNGSTQH